jgi:hypothetical protein
MFWEDKASDVQLIVEGKWAVWFPFKGGNGLLWFQLTIDEAIDALFQTLMYAFFMFSFSSVFQVTHMRIGLPVLN